mgnify:CR=1
MKNKHRRNLYLKRTYNISIEDYEILLARYGGCCWICRRPRHPRSRALAVDHNHKTKQVRGLLCWKCNRGIALLKENPTVLGNAKSYISENDTTWGGTAYQGISGQT